MTTGELTHSLYFVYAPDGRLLYIGQSGNVDARIKTHRTRAPWWVEGSRVERADGYTKSTARTAEAAAIREHKPPHNNVHNPDVLEAEKLAIREQGRLRGEQILAERQIPAELAERLAALLRPAITSTTRRAS